MVITESIQKAIQSAIAKCGSLLSFSRSVGVSHTTVSFWLSGRTRKINSTVWDNLHPLIQEYLESESGKSVYPTEPKAAGSPAFVLREKYAERDLPETIFWDSMTDLRAKLVECRAVYGINGSFVASWFHGFFEMTRFALGRLQFEITELSREEPYTCRGRSVREDDKLIGMHIPSLGPLTVDLMLDAFKRAYNFPLFSEVRVPGTDWMPFCCGSYLLYPPHYDFLPPQSNILKFMDCFDIIDYSDSEEFNDKWRIFANYKDAEPADLPRDTSLRRAFADRLLAGGKTGHGWGIFFFDGEKILKNGANR